MQIDDIKKQIRDTLITKSNMLSAAIIRREWFKTSELYKEIIKLTPFITNSKHEISERIYCVLNDITSTPLCKICGKQKTFKMFRRGYNKFCSGRYNKCSRVDVYWSNSEATKRNHKKEKDTFEAEYKEQKFQLIEVDQIVNFINKRLIDTDYGVEHFYVDRLILRTYKNELMSILNMTENILPINFKKIDWSQRFYILINSIKNPPKCTMCERNAKYVNIKRGYLLHCCNSCKNKDNINNINKGIELQNFTIISEYKRLSDQKLKIKCNKCGCEQEKVLFCGLWQDIYCPGCHGNYQVSIGEKEVVEFIKTFYTQPFKENVNIPTTQLEMDIYIPEKNFAIEYDGIYFHSFGTSKTHMNNIDKEETHKYRHLKKTELCQQNNVQLIHIFSNEWSNKIKQSIWKSVIRNKLGYSDKIYARKCIIKPVSYQDTQIFLNNNHLQGEDKSSIQYGLYYNSELVCVMTFGKPRFNDKYQYELIRYCNKLNTNVIGGASKLLKHFETIHKPQSLISYANRRYSNGNLYKKIGFNLSDTSLPNYWYIKEQYNEFYSRYQCQKHRLHEILGDKFDPNISEADNMINNGYRRLYDCGNYVFTKTYV